MCIAAQSCIYIKNLLILMSYQTDNAAKEVSQQEGKRK